jgi:hypothetical protein
VLVYHHWTVQIITRRHSHPTQYVNPTPMTLPTVHLNGTSPDRHEGLRVIIRTTKIDWDTDGDKEQFDLLPQCVALPVDHEDDIADYLSAIHGWCVFGVEYERDKEHYYDAIDEGQPRRIAATLRH